MKLALIGDLHGNLPATLAMEKELACAGAEEIWCLGDAIGKGPSNAETCDWVRANCRVVIGGNWDYGIGGRQFPADHYYWNQMGEERLRWLAELPAEGELLMSGVRFRLFHGRPVTELMVAQTDKDVLTACFDTDQGHFGGIIFADSHRPFIRTLNAGYAVNTGSVGNSLGVPRAHALLLEGEKDAVAPASLRMTILSLPYDNEAAAALARADEQLPFQQAYITEVLTGVYSR